MGRRKETLDIYGAYTEEWQESKARYVQLKEDRGKQVGLCIGIEVWGDKLEGR